MFISPYQTKAASWNPIDKIQSAMKLAKIEKRLIPATKPIPGLTGVYGPVHVEGMWFLVAGITGNDTETAFTNPITFTDTLGKQNIVIDARTALMFDQATGTIALRSRNAITDLQQQIIRMKAVWYWMSGNQRDFLNLSPIPLQVYVRWVAEAIANKTKMGYNEMPRFLAYCGWFFVCQFYNESDFADPAVRMNAVRKVTDQSRVRADVVAETLENAPFLSGVQSFVDHALEVVGAEELKLMDLRMFVSVAGGAWIGGHAAESGAIGLEYPPVFLSMLYGSANNSYYRNTVLGRILDRGEFKKTKEVFMRSFAGTIDL